MLNELNAYVVSTYEKDPEAVKDYTLDWSDWLGTDTISSCTWIVPTGIVKDSSGNTSTLTTIWLSGGTAGKRYKVYAKIVTAQGRTEVRGIEIVVVRR